MTLAVNPAKIVAAHPVATVEFKQNGIEVCLVSGTVIVQPKSVVHLCLAP